MRTYYKTDLGKAYLGKIEDFTRLDRYTKYHGKVNLIFTSPPFPLNRKKKYGNRQGQEYLEWIVEIFNEMVPFLTDDGSLVIEIGNSWEQGTPEMSTLPIETLLAIKNNCGLHLCQSFVWNNPARLPGPAQWVNIDRIRVKDSFTHIWWFSKTPRPKADNRKVLMDYSTSMKKLLKAGKYNSGKRPSEHVIGEKSFTVNNKGAIPSNVLTYSNTESNSSYINYCKENGIQLHPARMPKELPAFFINYLTECDDLVLDPFAGSNTTGWVSETMGRRWIAIDAMESYLEGSKGRFR